MGAKTEGTSRQSYQGCQQQNRHQKMAETPARERMVTTTSQVLTTPAQFATGIDDTGGKQ